MAWAAIWTLGACTQGAGLRDQLRRSDYNLPLDQRLRLEREAPLIVLGRVIGVTEVGRPVPSRSDARVKTQLDRIKINVEEVVKGSMSSSTLEFYYFTYSPSASEIDLGVPRYLPEVGQRRLYFLKAANGSYRSVGDITNYTLRVSSGSHQRGFCAGKSPGCCMAEILLVPQPDLDIRWFVVDLARSEYAAEVLCSRNATSDLMNRLVRNADQRISERAREVIAAGALIH